MPTGNRFAIPPVGRLHLLFFALCGVLAALLYLHGGATNPFVSLFLVPVAISAATLSARFTIALAAFCLLAYTLLLFYYIPLEVLSPAHEMRLDNDHHSLHMHEGAGINWHVVGMWMNFVLSSLLITYFVLRMAAALRAQDAELAAIREQQLRDEQLLGIATLAAGTLHELGTPLSTMALLADDLKAAAGDNPGVAEDAALLAAQVERCKLILRNLARAAEQPSDQARRIAAGDYLHDVLAHWQLLQPGVPVARGNLSATCFISVDSTLEQALINLLNNAAEASPEGIAVSVVTDESEQSLSIHIRDHGPGISVEPDNLGKPFVSTRGPGRGLGLFLSNATIERLGGRVHLQPQAGGGTLTTVTLPCVQ